ETVSVGDVIGILSDGAAPAPTPQAPTAVESPAPTPAPAPDFSGRALQEAAPPTGNGAEAADLHVSPVARRLAEDKNVDLRLVRASGPGDKITKEDVTTYLERRAEAPATEQKLAQQAAEAAHAAPVPVPGPSGRPEERVQISRLRRT